jgi:FkbM family methyltransferase
MIKNCQKFRNIIPVCAALSNHNGVSEFYQSSGGSDGSGSILPPTGHLEKFPTVTFKNEDKIHVPTITLDTYFEAKNISRVDLIWIDVQGAEKLVFEGATELLKVTSYIYLEVSAVSYYEGALIYKDMELYMAKLGFKVVQEFLPPEYNGDGNVLLKNINLL